MPDIEIPAIVEIDGEFRNVNEWSISELRRAARETDSISEQRGLRVAARVRELEQRMADDPAAIDEMQRYTRSLPTDVLKQLREQG